MKFGTLETFIAEGGDYGSVYRYREPASLSPREALTESSRGWGRGEWLRPEVDVDDAAMTSVAERGPVASLNARFFISYIDGLSLSNLSRLTRVVRDWNIEVLGSPFLGSFMTLHDYFHGLVIEGDHRLLRRGSAKRAWLWFRRWSDIVVGVLDENFSSGDMLELLTKAESKLRRQHRLSPPPRRLTRSDRLQYLADTIVGHAPPVPLSGKELATGAG